MVKRLADRDSHVLGLGQADQRAVSRAYRDLCFMTVLFDAEDNFGFELVAQDFTNPGEPGFYFFADGRSYFVMPPGVFHVHERHSLDPRSRSNQKFAVRVQK